MGPQARCQAMHRKQDHWATIQQWGQPLHIHLRPQGQKRPGDSHKTRTALTRSALIALPGATAVPVGERVVGSQFRQGLMGPLQVGLGVGSGAEVSQRSGVGSVPPLSSHCTCQRGCSWTQAEKGRQPQLLLAIERQWA